MGKIRSSFLISLDGVVKAPDRWHFPYFDEQMGAAIAASTHDASAFLMGRVLYDDWVAYWPSREQDPVRRSMTLHDVPLPQTAEEPSDVFASFINAVPKYVVSTTLADARWHNTTIVPGERLADRIEELKRSVDGTIAMSGSATLVRWLLDHDLLDELHLMIHPVVVGRGRRLFDGETSQPLRLVHQETFPNRRPRRHLRVGSLTRDAPVGCVDAAETSPRERSELRACGQCDNALD